MNTIAEQVENHLKYGNVTFEESGIAETDQFRCYFFDDNGAMCAEFIDGSRLFVSWER
tara:strand:- start:1030 stop:1203 length:174 start_codon:yes stop_codon:yes gene_type:complete